MASNRGGFLAIGEPPAGFFRPGFRPGFEMMPSFQMGRAIGGMSSGYDLTGEGAFEEEERKRAAERGGGAFSQIGDAIGGFAKGVGGLPGKAIGALGGAVGWDQMEPTEKAYLLSQAIGMGADIYGNYKQGKQEDEDRKRRQQSAESLRPYMQMLMSKAR